MEEEILEPKIDLNDFALTAEEEFEELIEKIQEFIDSHPLEPVEEV